MTTPATAVTGPLSISQVMGTQPNERSSEVILIPLDDQGNADITAFGGLPPLRFQYFPESLQDSKNINYQQKEIPGASLPLYQWVASGERLLAFTAQFSSDTDVLANPTLTPVITDNRLGLRDRNVDIRSAVAWLRSFMFPRYINASSGAGSAVAQSNASPGNSATSAGLTYLTKPPQRLRLYIPNSGIGIAGGTTSNAQQVFPDSVTCVMTQCEVTWDAFFPSGMPRLASVQLSFAQIPQIGTRVLFPSADNMGPYVQGNDIRPDRFFGYRLHNRFNRAGTVTG